MPYDPKETSFPYPEFTDIHYLPVKEDDGTVFDKNYPYIDETPAFERKRKLFRALLFLFANPVCRLRLMLRTNGREILKKNKNILKNGVISISNHVHMWDFIGEMLTVFPHRPNILAWSKNMRGENKKMIRLAGGIPVPENDTRAFVRFVDAIDQYLQKGGWLHIMAEGTMWEYYMPIRPFKKGAFFFAVRNNKPILPMAYSFREVKGPLKLIWKHAFLTLNIGEPLFPNTELNKEAAVEDLMIRAHESVCRLAGIEPSENLYPPVFDKTRRVDYYTTEYGKNYKGSF